MNSFRFVMQGINAEIARQIALAEAGEPIEQETLHFDPVSGRLSSLRSKEEAHDYRYFPEPDLVPIVPTPEMLEAARAAIPELPAARQARYEELGLPEDTAHLFAFEPEWGDYFEAVPGEPQGRGQLGDRAALARRAPTPSRPRRWASWSSSWPPARSPPARAAPCWSKLIETGDDPAEIVEREGLAAMEDSGELEAIVAKVIADHPDVVERIKGGNAKAMGALVGPVMRETKGRADGGEVNRLLRAAARGLGSRPQLDDC